VTAATASTTLLTPKPPPLVPMLKTLRLGGIQDTLPLRLDQAQLDHSSLALRVGRDTTRSDELSDLRAVLDRVSHGSRQDPGVWLAVVAVSRR
jgi:hypothetical protein